MSRECFCFLCCEVLLIFFYFPRQRLAIFHSGRSDAYSISFLVSAKSGCLTLLLPFAACFSFLVHFCCQNNVINKNLLARNINDVFLWLDQQDHGQNDLVCEIYTNNKQKLFDPQVEALVRRYLRMLSGGRRFHHRYLRFIRTSMTYCNEPIKHNFGIFVNAIIESGSEIEMLHINADDPANLVPVAGEAEAGNAPYVYQAGVLEIYATILLAPSKINSLFSNRLKHQLNLNHVLRFLALPDVFSPRQRKKDCFELILRFNVKVQLLRLAQIVWVKDALYTEVAAAAFVELTRAESEKLRDFALRRDFKHMLTDMVIDDSCLEDTSVVHVGAEVKLSRKRRFFRSLCAQLDLSLFREHYAYYFICDVLPVLAFCTEKILKNLQKNQNELLDAVNRFLGLSVALIRHVLEVQRALYEQYPEVFLHIQHFRKRLESIDQMSAHLENLDLALKSAATDATQHPPPAPSKSYLVHSHYIQEQLLAYDSAAQDQSWKLVLVSVLMSNSYQRERLRNENYLVDLIQRELRDKRNLNLFSLKLIQFVESSLENSSSADSSDAPPHDDDPDCLRLNLFCH